MFQRPLISLHIISMQLSNFMVCNALEPMATLATLNDALTHSLNKPSIKRKSGKCKSPPGKPPSPRKQQRRARKRRGSGSATNHADQGAGSGSAPSTNSKNDADRRARLMALKRGRDEEASPEVQAKKDQERDRQTQKRCGFFITGPSNTVRSMKLSIYPTQLLLRFYILSPTSLQCYQFSLFTVSSQGKTLFMSLFTQVCMRFIIQCEVEINTKLL